MIVEDRDGWHAALAAGTGMHRYCTDYQAERCGPHWTYGHSGKIDLHAFWPLEWRLVVMWCRAMRNDSMRVDVIVTGDGDAWCEITPADDVLGGYK